MFVLGPDADNRELKAPHVPGEDELDFTSTSLSLKSKQPIIHAISFSLFGSVLDLQEFSVQTHFLFFGTGLSHDKISHGTAASNVWDLDDRSMSSGVLGDLSDSLWYTAVAVPWSVFMPQGVDSRKSMLSSANQTNMSFTNQGGRKTPPMDFVFSRTVFAMAVSISITFL